MEKIDRPSLKQYMEEVKPDTGNALLQFLPDFIGLHHSGYSVRLMFDYVKRHGYTGSQATFYRWIKKHVDFDQVSPTPAEAKPSPQTTEPKKEEKEKEISAPEKRDPKAIMDGILGTSIEDQLKEFK